MNDYTLKKLVFLSICFVVFGIFDVVSQNKKPLDFSVYDTWKNLENEKISHDGRWCVYEINPQDGDGVLHLVSLQSNKKTSLARATKAGFLPTSDFAVAVIKPQKDTVLKMKRNKVDKEKMPKDSLAVINLNNQSVQKFERIKSYKIPKESGDWIVFQHEKSIEEADSTKSEDKEKKTEKKDKNAPDVSELVIYHPANGKKYSFHSISAYDISRNGKRIAFIKLRNDSIVESTVYLFDTQEERLDSFPPKSGISKKIVCDNKGEQIAFIHSEDTIKTKVYSLFYVHTKENKPLKIVDTLTSAIPEKWTVSEHRKIKFSRDDSKLYFGTAPKPTPEPEDTLLDEEKVFVDIWHWKDPFIQPQQLANVDKEKKRTYLCVYHTGKDKVVQLADKTVRNVSLIRDGNGNVALGKNSQLYHRLLTWEYPLYYDIYIVDVNSGKKSKIMSKIQSRLELSPGGNFLLYFEQSDSSWYAYDLAAKTSHSLTKDIPFNFYDEEHDYPAEPFPYGVAGWVENDSYVLLYDCYDIWKIDPGNNENPVNLTMNKGRENHTRFRYQKLDKEAFFIEKKQDILLRAFNEKNKQSGYFSVNVKANKPPKQLIMQDYRFTSVKKAKNENRLIWQKENISVYPDLWQSNLSFDNPKRLTELNPQQKEYNWATVELVTYHNLDGDEMEGLVYKPENFEPNKKYPLMVYFYRLHSDELHYHYTPRPSRSIINPLFYASNGYIVFIPNVRYKTGYPGESAVSCVVSGTNFMTYKPYIDKENIGIQGQSWGGYQIAYIVTQTDMYKAASPGAPVSNMVSAYGGIRWKSGMSRMFQYEESQSRIGGTLWEKPFRYIENSPVFYADRINTPLLIRHDDNDGAVPWYQGIELYVALRRLNKPVWLVNYNDSPHNLTKKRSNQKDWSKRMLQFYDHYLKGKPAPVWLEEGIPAIKKGKTMGYELKK